MKLYKSTTEGEWLVQQPSEEEIVEWVAASTEDQEALNAIYTKKKENIEKFFQNREGSFTFVAAYGTKLDNGAYTVSLV